MEKNHEQDLKLNSLSLMAQQNEKDHETISKQIDNIGSKLDTFIDKIDEKYVTNDKFWPVKTIVYSLTGIILTGVFVAFLSLVI